MSFQLCTTKEFLWALGMGTFEGATDIVNSPAVLGRLIHLSWLSSGMKSCRKHPYRAVVPKNHISRRQFPDDFRHLGGPLGDCCCDNNPLRLILGTPLLWLNGLFLRQWWVARGLREQRTNPGCNCLTGERKRRPLASLLSWQWHCINAKLCLSLQTTLIAFRETLFAKTSLPSQII